MPEGTRCNLDLVRDRLVARMLPCVLKQNSTVPYPFSARKEVYLRSQEPTEAVRYSGTPTAKDAAVSWYLVTGQVCKLQHLQVPILSL